MEIFKDHRYKREQLPNIAGQNKGKVTLYRMGTHIDIIRGPMVGSSSFLGKCTIAAVHEIANEGDEDAIYRVQGVALPAGIRLNHVSFRILENRARKMHDYPMNRLKNRHKTMTSKCKSHRIR